MDEPTRREILKLGIAAGALIGGTSGTEAQENGAAPDTEAVESFGWMPDLPDLADETLASLPVLEADLPKKISLKSQFPAPYNQGQIGSCTANALAGAMQYSRRVTGKTPDFLPSRLFIYYQERVIEGTVFTDSGARIQTGIDVLRDLGAPPESEWSYDSTPANSITHVFASGSKATQAPSAKVMTSAAKYQTISKARLQQKEKDLKSCLASGFPFVFGFRVYKNFDRFTKTLNVPDPNSAKVAGHAVLAVGYDDDTRMFRIRNSWGSFANDGGYFDMSYDYVSNSNLCSDFWAVYETEAMTVFQNNQLKLMNDR